MQNPGDVVLLELNYLSPGFKKFNTSRGVVILFASR